MEGQLASQQELQEGRGKAKVLGSGRAGQGRAGQQACGEGVEAATVKSTLGVAHVTVRRWRQRS